MASAAAFTTTAGHSRTWPRLMLSNYKPLNFKALFAIKLEIGGNDCIFGSTGSLFSTTDQKDQLQRNNLCLEKRKVLIKKNEIFQLYLGNIDKSKLITDF